jgi:hypothetical protein
MIHDIRVPLDLFSYPRAASITCQIAYGTKDEPHIATWRELLVLPQQLPSLERHPDAIEGQNRGSQD